MIAVGLSNYLSTSAHPHMFSSFPKYPLSLVKNRVSVDFGLDHLSPSFHCGWSRTLLHPQETRCPKRLRPSESPPQSHRVGSHSMPLSLVSSQTKLRSVAVFRSASKCPA